MSVRSSCCSFCLNVKSVEVDSQACCASTFISGLSLQLKHCLHIRRQEARTDSQPWVPRISPALQQFRVKYSLPSLTRSRLPAHIAKTGVQLPGSTKNLAIPISPALGDKPLHSELPQDDLAATWEEGTLKKKKKESC